MFQNLFEIRAYNVELGGSAKRKFGKDFQTYYSPNPILNNCLRYALRNLSKYRNQAIEILKFGMKHNRRIAEGHDINDCYVCNELGGIRDIKESDFYGFYEFAIVTYEKDIHDKEINQLIGKLPKFNDRGGW